VTDEATCTAEIIALHQTFESWLGEGAGDPARFDAAFDPGFAMVMPDGRRLDRPAVLAFLRNARGVRGADFRIAIEEAEALHVAPPLVLMHYVERQWIGAVETARRATALFRIEVAQARWLSVQETWVTPPP
jgi:hypothetical protein